MLSEYEEKICEFCIENGCEGPENKILAAIHLMSEHSLDKAQALAQTLLDGNGDGIDSWYYGQQKGELIVYNSCLRRNPSEPILGLAALIKSVSFLEEVILNNFDPSTFDHDPCLYNLTKVLKEEKDKIQRISFKVISPFSEKEVSGVHNIANIVEPLRRSKLNKNERYQISYGFDKYNLKPVISKIKEYLLEGSEISRISLDGHTYMELTYAPLHDLVELYRQRGEMLFEKNIRLSLKNLKKAKDRLVTPMEGTLNKICNGTIPAEIFTFYHGGVTLSADFLDVKKGTYRLEGPSVINGCQTITIANDFLKKMDQSQNQEKLNRFRSIKVIAKIVVGANEEDLREITNANNRHNSIDNWQLYSNSPIHIEIELALKKRGIFYERQEGKFESQKDKESFSVDYHNTNKTFISVQYLGQIIALSKRQLEFAAKKSEIFTRTENHDLIYDPTIPSKVDDIVFIFNLNKALDRALSNYLQKPSYADSVSRIFDRPLVQANINFLGCLYYYQKENKDPWRQDYHKKLNKKASPNLVSDIETTYLFKVMSKIKTWYINEYGVPDENAKKLKEPSKTKLKAYIDELAEELGIDLKGNTPFVRSIDWASGSSLEFDREDEEDIKI